MRVHASVSSFCTLKTEQREYEESKATERQIAKTINCGTFNLKGKTITISKMNLIWCLHNSRTAIAYRPHYKIESEPSEADRIRKGERRERIRSFRESGNEVERASFDVGQANKSARGMPWHQEPMKDVTSCDKLRGAAHTH